MHAWDVVSAQTIVNCWRHRRPGLYIDENDEMNALLQKVYYDLEIDDDMQLTESYLSILTQKEIKNFENVTDKIILATITNHSPMTQNLKTPLTAIKSLY